ncbi:MAG TPA: 1-acyl-sn-glycerol-3-phosphate acyltransferase, partial [Sphingomicrobium sp.]|nr:1-acyl-sn-glycerol-3-phosphate acyltransferase [Sphingomicrobium sp.]
MQLIRSIAYALVFYPATMLFVLAGIVVPAFGRESTRALVLRWTGFHRWLARNVLGIRTNVEGEIPRGAVLIAVKHQSMYETLEMVRLAHAPVIVLKRELSQIPLFGWLT